MTVEPIQPYLEAVRKAVTVPRPPAEAFEIFTARIASWWPLHAYSVNQARAKSCAIEPHVGGAVYEVRDDGERCEWGCVLAWEPPHRLLLTWHPGHDPALAQELEIRFTPVAGGTRVELEHRGWAKLAARAQEARAAYEGGWQTVLGKHFVEACT